MLSVVIHLCVIAFIFNIISWNLRGAASRRSLCNLRNVVRLHSLHMLIVLEPRVSGVRADIVAN